MPWFRRPRQPFDLNGFTLRLVVPLIVLGPVLVTAGVIAVVTAEAPKGGAVQIAIGLVLLAASAAYFVRPVNR